MCKLPSPLQFLSHSDGTFINEMDLFIFRPYKIYFKSPDATVTNKMLKLEFCPLIHSFKLGRV